MATLTFTVTTVTDPEDGSQYIDYCPKLDGVTTRVEYCRPLHLSTAVATGGAATGQAVVPLDDVGDLATGRKILIVAAEHEILTVDSVSNEITLTANLGAALSGAEAVTTTDTTVENEISADLTARGYSIS